MGRSDGMTVLSRAEVAALRVPKRFWRVGLFAILARQSTQSGYRFRSPAW
jgi:hypothetical protein